MSGPLDPPTIHQTYVTRARQYLTEKRPELEASWIGTGLTWQAYRAGAGEVIIEQLLEVIDAMGGTDGEA